MNKELLKLLELIKTYQAEGKNVLTDTLEIFTSNYAENEELTVKELIDIMETEMSYWEE